MSLFYGCIKEKGLKKSLFQSYSNYLRDYLKGKKGSRSTNKLLPLHGFIAKSIKESLENNFKTTFEVFYLNGKEVEIDGEFSSKRVDIFISMKGNYKIVRETERKVKVYVKNPNFSFIFSVKFITSNYKQNSNNYFENLIGECVNLKLKGFKFAHLLFFKYPLPYFDKEGKITKFEEIEEKDILKYYKLFQNRDKEFSPNFLFLGIYEIVPYGKNKLKLEKEGKNIIEIARNLKYALIRRILPPSIKTKTLIEFLSQPFCKFLDELAS
jgi:hypothetical protein